MSCYCWLLVPVLCYLLLALVSCYCWLLVLR